MKPGLSFAGAGLAVLLAMSVAAPVDAADHVSPRDSQVTTGWTSVATWEGAVTYACQAARGDDEVDVKVYWDGTNYPTSAPKGRFPWWTKGSGGLAYVRDNWSQYGWTYTDSTSAGEVSPVVSLNFYPDDYVYLIAGSRYGITVESIRPVSTLATCPGTVAASPRSAADSGAPTTSESRAGGCATKREFKRLHKKMTPVQVRKVLGTKGKEVTSAEYSLVRRYRSCGKSPQVIVNFQRRAPRSRDKLVTSFR